MIRDLSTFGLVESPQDPPVPPVPCTPGADRTVLINRAGPLTSWQRAWTVAMESRQRYPAVWIVPVKADEDGRTIERDIRGVLEATN